MIMCAHVHVNIWLIMYIAKYEIKLVMIIVTTKINNYVGELQEC